MGRGRGGGKRGGVSFNKPPEPAFLRRIKEQLGFQEGPNIDTKVRMTFRISRHFIF